MKTLAKLSILLFFTTHCIIGYKDYPKIPPVPDLEKKIDANLVYALPTFPQLNLGGREALKNFFETKTPFKKTIEGLEVPKQGYLVNVKVTYRSPSTAAAVFLGISTVLATLPPAWSKQDGYDLEYILYKNGNKVGTYQYHIYRDYYQWIGLALFAWYNFETASEKEVFERISIKFFEDAKEHF